MREGFRWCPHCKGPHPLTERLCASTGEPFEEGLHRPLTPSAPRPALLGVVFDRKYRIIRLLGAGGMGQVFEAENIHLKRLVAIKVIAGTGADAWARLEREAQLVAAIHHPNICDVYELGRMPNGGPYVVFERLFGETLAARTRELGRLSVRAAIAIFSQMLAGLHAAHAAHIIHRDLKPQNVFLVDLVGGPPLVKLVDFGFAQDLAMTGASRLTRPGRLCGTVQYMSPEQLRGEALDHRSDLFAIGVMLYEALTGRHPFAAESRLELQTNILRATPRPLRERRPSVPQALAEVIAWAMAKVPSARPPSAPAMQGALLSTMPADSLPLVSDDEPVSGTEPVWLPPSSSPSP